MKAVQLTRRFRLDLRIPAGEIDIALLDEWLEGALELTVPPCPEPTIELRDDDYAVVYQLLWRKLALVRMLLQFAMIPAFVPGSVVKLDRSAESSSSFTALITLPYVHNFSPVYKFAIDHALKIGFWMLVNPRAPATEDQLFTRFEKDVIPPLLKARCGGRSTLPILEEALSQDIPFQHLGLGTYQLGWGRHGRLLDRSITQSDSVLGARLSHSKYSTVALLEMAGLPVPKSFLATDKKTALMAAQKLGWPVVVKPNDGEGGVGVTIGVSNAERLLHAFDVALEGARAGHVLIEQQVKGICHRLFVQGARLLFATKRLPIAVQGDGEHTVEWLIHQQNAREQKRAPWLRSKSLPLDDLAGTVLDQAGYRRDSVPAAGSWVALRDIESTRWGGRGEDMTDSVHPENLQIALQCAELFRLDVAGVDIISNDISVPWNLNGARINEVNSGPLLGVFPVTKKYMPLFLRNLLSGDGRIPVEVFVGGEQALERARARQSEWVAKGVDSFLCSHNLTLAPAGGKILAPVNGLAHRTTALLLNPRLECLILVVQTDEIIEEGLPVDSLDHVTLVDGPLIKRRGSGVLGPDEENEVMQILKKSMRGLAAAARD